MKRILLLLLLGLLLTCTTNPRTGRSQLIFYSESSMVKLGAETYLVMTDPSKVAVSNDPRLTAPLQRVGAAISEAAEKPEYEWDFKVIDAPETPNAWALPGGKIAFYTGIYPVLQDEAGMAIVMGHEVMHSILRHSNERLSQGQLTAGVVTAAAIALEDSEYRAEIVGALGVGASFGFILPYSRKHESEADKYGLFLAAKAGYDPEAAIGVWQRMAQLGSGSGQPEFMSTHPAPERRIQNMRDWMPEAKLYYEQAPVKRVNRPLPPIK